MMKINECTQVNALNSTTILKIGIIDSEFALTWNS